MPRPILDISLICAGIHLRDGVTDATQREMILKRREIVLRLERFWALANVLVRPDNSGGIRGVTYAKAKAEELRRSCAIRTSAKYPLLSRQTQYGAIGMFASVADGMRFLNRDDFTLTPALGEVTAEAFSMETSLPKTLRQAILDDGDISLATLSAWGERAHVDAEVRAAEAGCHLDDLNSNPIRSRMTSLLKSHPPNKKETELGRMSRLALELRKTDQQLDLCEAIECILEFESCYRLAILTLERLIWKRTQEPDIGIPKIKCHEMRLGAQLRTFCDPAEAVTRELR